MKTALVLMGGGARGAYEAGVMRYLYERIAGIVGREQLFELFAGTSAGALNACTAAAFSDDPLKGSKELVEYWRSITMNRLLSFGYKELRQLPDLLLGRTRLFDLGAAASFLRSKKRKQPTIPMHLGAPHPPIQGIFDTTPLRRDMRSLIPWSRLQRNLQEGKVSGLAACATEVCTSRSVVFYQMAPGESFAWVRDDTRIARPVLFRARHAMASAAIPFLFPAVQINGVCYVDGALRQNTPLYPAIRMGATKLLMIGLTCEPKARYRIARRGCQRNAYPGSLFLLGRTVNALMDGSLDQELRRVETINALLDPANGATPAFIDHLNQVSSRFRNTGFRKIDTLMIRPSRSLSELAHETIREAPEEIVLPGVPGQLVTKAITSEAVMESELASFLLFVPTYSKKLLELGFQDAQARHDELVAFFSEQ